MLLGWCVEWGGVLMAGMKKRKGCVSCASSSLVIRLGLEPKTPTLKVLCSTS